MNEKEIKIGKEILDLIMAKDISVAEDIFILEECANCLSKRVKMNQNKLNN